MTQSNRVLWTPTGPLTTIEKAKVTCYLPIDQPPTQLKVSSQIKTDLEWMLLEWDPAQLKEMTIYLQDSDPSPDQVFLSLLKETNLGEILEKVDWENQKIDQPPSQRVLREYRKINPWYYLPGAV